jgi:hypothetical protein
VEQRRRVLAAYVEQRRDLGPAWEAAASLSDYALRLPPESARAMAAELDAVLARWRDDAPDGPTPGTELVLVHVDVLPMAQYPL